MFFKDYSCPTIRVKLIETGDIYVINEDEFDEELHEELEPEPEPQAKPVSSLLSSEIENAIEQLSDIELEQLTSPGSSSSPADLS